MPRRGLSAVAKERPFDGRLHVLPFDGRRLSIADALASIEDLPADFADRCVARVNGEIVPRHMWKHVYPRDNPFVDVAVTFTLPMRGGRGGQGGGNKNVLATIATIVVLLAAAAVSGGALAGVTGGFLAAGTVAASVAGAAVGIAGSLAVAALIPPPRASAKTTDATVPESGQQSLPASLTGNALAPGAPIPRVVGTMRVFPPLACQPLVEVIGDLEYAEAVMVLSGPHALSDLRVGNVSSADIAELDIELQEGLQESPIQSLVSRYGATSTPNVDVVGHITNPSTQSRLTNQADPDLASPQWFSLVTRDSPDEIWINLAWPEGLFCNAAPTDVVNQAVRIRFRERGDVSWVNCPEIHFSSNSPNPFQKVIRLKWGTIPAAPNLPPSAKGPIYAYKTVPAQSVAPATAGWTADSYFSSGSGSDLLSVSTLATTKVINTELYQDKVIFYLDENTFPKGIYEIQIMRAVPYQASGYSPANYYFTAVGSQGVGLTTTTTVYDFFKYTSNSGFYVTPFDPGQFHHRIIIPRLSSVWNENPIQSEDFATVSIRVHSRALEQVSVLASGYVRDWDGSAWAHITTTSNPAAHFYDVLTGVMGATPLDAAMVDSAGLVAWRTACDSLGYTCDAVLEGKSYEDALNLIASCGYARLRHNEQWGVFRDKDRSADTPVQIFTPRNMNGFSFTKAFARRPTGIRASFVNADLDYAQDEVIVYDDPDNPDGSQLEQITYDGLVDSADVEARAEFDLIQSDKRLTFYSGTADWEALVCTRGDLVGVQYDVIADKAGFARIVEVLTSGSNVTGLRLEGTVPVPTADAWSDTASAWSDYDDAWSLARTGVAIRLKGGNGILTKEITGASDEVSTVSFATPFTDPGTSQLDVDCLCAVGPLGSEYRRLIVSGIQPEDDLSAKITFVDEAPELWAA